MKKTLLFIVVFVFSVVNVLSSAGKAGHLEAGKSKHLFYGIYAMHAVPGGF